MDGSNFPCPDTPDNTVDAARLRSPWAGWRSAAQPPRHFHFSRHQVTGLGHGETEAWAAPLGPAPHPQPASRSDREGCTAPAGKGGGSGRQNAAGKFPSEPRGLAGGYSGSGAHNGSIVCTARVQPGTELPVTRGRERRKKKTKNNPKTVSLFFSTHMHTHPHTNTYLYSILSSFPALIPFFFFFPPPLICSWTTLRAFKNHEVLTPQQFD